MLKAPLVPSGAPVVNALFTQRCSIVNVMRTFLGLGLDNNMTLEHRLESTLDEMQEQESIGQIRLKKVW
jgi:myo-inositol-1-phosphate synthase